MSDINSFTAGGGAESTYAAEVARDLEKLLNADNRSGANIGILLSESATEEPDALRQVLPGINWLQIPPELVIGFLRENINRVAMVAYRQTEASASKAAGMIKRGGALVDQLAPEKLPVIPPDGLLKTHGLPVVNLKNMKGGPMAMRSAVLNRLNFVVRLTEGGDVNDAISPFLTQFSENTSFLKVFFGSFDKFCEKLFEAKNAPELKAELQELGQECLETVLRIEEVMDYLRAAWPDTQLSDMGHYINNPLGILSANMTYLNSIFAELLGKEDGLVSLVKARLADLAQLLKNMAEIYPSLE